MTTTDLSAVPNPVFTTASGEQFSLTPHQVADILENVIKQLPNIRDMIKKYGAFASLLPKPFNMLGDPKVLAIVEQFESMLPVMQQIHDILEKVN